MIDPGPLLDEAAILAARFGGGLIIAQTVAAGLTFGRQGTLRMSAVPGHILVRGYP